MAYFGWCAGIWAVAISGRTVNTTSTVKEKNVIKHIVMWTLKNPADIPKMKQLLESCQAVVPGIAAFEVGVRSEGLEANADVVLYSAFADQAALQAYQQHPHHVAVAAQVGPLCQTRTAIDYAV